MNCRPTGTRLVGWRDSEVKEERPVVFVLVYGYWSEGPTDLQPCDRGDHPSRGWEVQSSTSYVSLSVGVTTTPRGASPRS